MVAPPCYFSLYSSFFTECPIMFCWLFSLGSRVRSKSRVQVSVHSSLGSALRLSLHQVDVVSWLGSFLDPISVRFRLKADVDYVYLSYKFEYLSNLLHVTVQFHFGRLGSTQLWFGSTSQHRSALIRVSLGLGSSAGLGAAQFNPVQLGIMHILISLFVFCIVLNRGTKLLVSCEHNRSVYI
ncbi:hypothetical protein Hanom_Chr08g00744191 [Helianthus anomalus]